MALVDGLLDRKIYLVTNIFVYAVEGFEPYAEPLKGLLAAIDAARVTAVTSEVTLAECLVKPMIDRHTPRQELYLRMLTSRPGLSIVGVSREVLIGAARLRAGSSSLRLPDAIHLSTAFASGCSGLLTNDHALTTSAGIEVLLLDKLLADQR